LIIPFIVIPISVQNKQFNNNLITVLNSKIPAFNSNNGASSINSSKTDNEIVAPIPAHSSTSAPILSSKGISISAIDSRKILSILYISTVILLLFRFFKNIFIIRKKLSQSEETFNSGYRIALLDSQVDPFCFLNTVFVNKRDYLNNNLSKELLAHEFEHIRQSHSFDVIFVEIVQIFFWFNPILVLYNKAVRENHEYLADNGVILFSSDIKGYAENLLNFVSGNRNIPLTSGFNQSLTRKRLLMLTKTNANILYDRLRIFITICLVIVSFLLLSCKLSNKQNINIDLESNIGNFKELTLSQLNAKISYLPLSNSQLNPFSRSISIDVSEDFILINDNKQCLLYDKNGKILAKIYEKDRSENEKGVLNKSRFGPPNIIYIKNTFNLMEFDYSGKYLRTIDINKEKSKEFYFSSWEPINDSLIFVQIPNDSGIEKSKATIFNSNGVPVYRYTNYITLNRPRRMISPWDGNAGFSFYKNHFYFKEIFNDTLFYLSSDYNLVPELVFNLGKYSEPDSIRENFLRKGNPSGYVYINNTFQSKDFLILDCNFTRNIPEPEKVPGLKQWWEEGRPWYNTTQVLGLYNRSDKTLSFSKLTSTANTLFTTGFYNDIDAGPRFYPAKQINDTAFVMCMTANSFKDHIKSDDFKNNNPKFPDKKRSLEELAGKLTDPDELILMYVTVK
jgi:beta-lactamase regulating signal transducer with metallopeptidase domain